MATWPSGSEPRRAAALSGVACALVAACSQEMDLPTPPDVSSLRQAYDSPDGTVDASAATTALVVAQGAFRVLEQVNAGTLLGRLLAALPSQFALDGLPLNSGPYAAKANGVVTLHTACDGWRGAAGAASTDPGTIDLTGIVQRSVFFGEIWGHATACKQTQDFFGFPVNVSFDGDIVVSMDDPNTTDLSSHRWLVQLSGPLTAGPLSLSGPTDFRVGRDTLEVRIRQGDATSVIVAIGARGVEVRAANGTFGCDVTTYVCARSPGSP